MPAGWWRPVPWLLALVLVLILLVVWLVTIGGMLRLPDPDQARPDAA